MDNIKPNFIIKINSNDEFKPEFFNFKENKGAKLFINLKNQTVKIGKLLGFYDGIVILDMEPPRKYRKFIFISEIPIEDINEILLITEN